MEILVLALFCTSLVVCVITNISIIFALIFGLLLFLIYGKTKHFTWKELFTMSLDGIKTIKNLLFVFVLIGMLTASWRAAGTIPYLICLAEKFIHPHTFILLAFLLNCVVSVLTGTAFGTVATMGVVCMSIGVAMEVNPVIVGGAIMSGIFFGDRCSPVSTSALLVSEITGTNIFDNVKRMIRTALVPFIVSCIFYFSCGMIFHSEPSEINITNMFSGVFELSFITLIPAILILILSLLKVNVRINMTVSILAAVLICFFVQHMNLGVMLSTLVTGYKTTAPILAKMLNGGGITSMVNGGLIVGLSASYAGIFKKTGLLTFLENYNTVLSKKITNFGSILITSVITSMIGCNQTLSIMLTSQLCSSLEKDNKKFAIMLEDSAVVIAPLIPWSIAATIPLATLSAPGISLIFAIYLYLIPVKQLFHSFLSRNTDIKDVKSLTEVN